MDCIDSREAWVFAVGNRKDDERKGLRYPSDQTDGEWALARPFLCVGEIRDEGMGDTTVRRSGRRSLCFDHARVVGTLALRPRARPAAAVKEAAATVRVSEVAIRGWRYSGDKTRAAAKRIGKLGSKSSSARMRPRASWSCPNAGLSSGRSAGLAAAAASRGTSKT